MTSSANSSAQFRPSKLGTMLGPGARKHRTTGKMHYYLGIIDLDRGPDSSRIIDMDYLGHGIAIDPLDCRRAVLFEKHGPGCSAIDLHSGETKQVIETSKQRQFYGHGSFSRDGSLLYCVETDLEDADRGFVVVRDGRDFQKVGEFPSYGNAPHDLLLIDGGRTLVMSNGGSSKAGSAAPNVAFVDIATQKLKTCHEIPAAHLNAGHIAITRDGGLVVVSAPKAGTKNPEKHRGGICIANASAPMFHLHEPEDVTAKMLGETLSVAVHEASDTIAATNPKGDVVTFWRRSSGTWLKTLRVPDPRGVAVSLDEKEFILSFNTVPRYARIDPDTLDAVDVPGNRQGFPSMASGSHIVMYDL